MIADSEKNEALFGPVSAADNQCNSLFALLNELRYRELLVRKQQNRVDKFVLQLLSSANFSNHKSPPNMHCVFPEHRR